MTKKEKEFNLLKAVYKIPLYTKVLESEKPDYILEYNDYFFGVEITETFETNSSARIKNIPNYLRKILDNSEYYHKDDKESLKVEKAEILNKDGEIKDEITGIMMKKLSPDEYTNIIIERIITKGEKFANYNKNLTEISLIIHDTENYYSKKDMHVFNYGFLKTENRDLIIASPFSEIFLITILDENEKEPIVINLKLTCFLIESRLGAETVKDLYSNESDSEQFKVLAYYLKTLGFNIKVQKDKKDNYYFYMGNDCLRFKENKLEIFISYNIPKKDELTDIEIEDFKCKSDFIKKALVYRTDFVFSTLVYRPINEALYYQKK